MELDRHDIWPLTVILGFAIILPLALCFGFATRQQLLGDVSNLAKGLTIGILLLAGTTVLFSFLLRRREKRFLRLRGEVDASSFAALFVTGTEQSAARLIFELLRQKTAMGRVPRLELEDRLTGPPLFLVEQDLTQDLEDLCAQLDLCTTLDPDGEADLYEAETVAQLVSALAHFLEVQRPIDLTTPNSP